jgi:biotin carboxyl carrier protein
MTKYRIKLNGKVYEMEVELVDENSVPQPVKAASSATAPATMHETPVQSTVVAPSSTVNQAGAITSPLQGTIIKINAANGDAVKAGQTIIVLEAMKMQNDIAAPKDGTLSDLAVGVGDNVKSGQVLCVVK